MDIKSAFKKLKYQQDIDIQGCRDLIRVESYCLGMESELTALRAEVGRLVALNDRLIANERRLVEQLRQRTADADEPSKETIDRWLHDFAAWYFNAGSGMLSSYSKERGCWLSPDIQKRWESYAADRKELYKSMRALDRPIPQITDHVEHVRNMVPRITEQEAREIHGSALLYLDFDSWFESEGRDLLNKLNADREQVPAVSVPDFIIGVISWLDASLKCEQFPWDGDQHEAASYELELAKKWAMLSASPAPTNAPTKPDYYTAGHDDTRCTLEQAKQAVADDIEFSISRGWPAEPLGIYAHYVESFAESTAPDSEGER